LYPDTDFCPESTGWRPDHPLPTSGGTIAAEPLRRDHSRASSKF
jgi:hypothetical protein